MNYLKHYNLLIETRKKLDRKKGGDEYFENHHILPKCYGGEDTSENLVLLTAREHFLAHWLLWRAKRDRKSAAMFNGMCRKGIGQKRISSGRGYQEAKELGSFANKGRVHTPAARKAISEGNARRGKPNWNSGKTWKKNKYECSKCGEMVSQDHLRRWHEDNCQLEEYRRLFELHSRKEVLILKNISNARCQYWVNKVTEKYGHPYSA